MIGSTFLRPSAPAHKSIKTTTRFAVTLLGVLSSKSSAECLTHIGPEYEGRGTLTLGGDVVSLCGGTQVVAAPCSQRRQRRLRTFSPVVDDWI